MKCFAKLLNSFLSSYLLKMHFVGSYIHIELCSVVCKSEGNVSLLILLVKKDLHRQIFPSYFLSLKWHLSGLISGVLVSGVVACHAICYHDGLLTTQNSKRPRYHARDQTRCIRLNQGTIFQTHPLSYFFT